MSKNPTKDANNSDSEGEDEGQIRKRMERFVFDAYQKEKMPWNSYVFQFEKICMVKGLGGSGVFVTTARKDLLLAYVGAEALQDICNYFYPRDVDTCSYDEVKTAFAHLYKPEITIFAARMNFEKVVRTENESFTIYANRLRKISAACFYGPTLDERLRDRFVAGINHSRLETEVRQRWPDGKTATNETLSFQEVFDLARTMERAEAEVKKPKPSHISKMAIGKAAGTKKGSEAKMNFPQAADKQMSQKTPKAQETKLCGRCGKTWHKSPKDCPALKQKCRVCHKWGHYANVCLSAAGKNNSSAKFSANNVQPGAEKAKVINAISPKAIIEVKLNGLMCKMEYDTGAGVSTINTLWWEKLGKPKLANSSTELLTYSGKPLKTLGTTSLEVMLGNRSLPLEATVVETRDAPLFGLPWVLAFNISMPEGVTIHGTSNESKEMIEVSNHQSSPTAENFIDEYKQVFEEGFGLIKGFRAKIHVKSDIQPVFIPARRTPFPLRKPIENELQRLEQAGIIERVDPAITEIEWATPTVNVLKNDGTVRICGDFRVTINPHLSNTHHLMPTFEDIASRIVGGKEFSIIDLRDAYLQMEVDAESQRFLTLSTHKGFFRYKRLPFGIAAAPAIFQRFMEDLLKELNHVGVMLDDVIVTGATREEHVQNLRQVLQRLQTIGLKAKASKLRLFQKSVTYLGHRIDASGIHPSDEKIQAIRDTPSPRNASELRSFLGLLNYYEKFIPDLHAECSELHRLTGSKTPWNWTDNCQETFEKLKTHLSSDATLTPYDGNLPITIACDASEKGLGAVISHVMPSGEERPIAFASRTLADCEKRYSSLDREALALVFGITKFHQYIYGRNFTLYTDHKPLIYIFGDRRDLSKTANNRVARWALTLSRYNYTIKFRPGKENSGADTLSRLPSPCSNRSEEEGITIHDIRERTVQDMALTEKDIRRATARDMTLNRLSRFISENAWPMTRTQLPESLRPFWDKKTELSYEGGIVMWLGRVVVPERLRDRILAVLHEGHPGTPAMRSIARYYVWWPKIDTDIQEYVKRCEACQENRPEEVTVPLYSWNIPQSPWERVQIDITGPFDRRMWLVATDALTKWAEVEDMKSIKTKPIIIKLRQWFARYGVPQQLVTDNASQFTGKEFQTFCQQNGIKHIMTTPYHPKTNGLVERFNQTFKNRYSACRHDEENAEVCVQRMLMTYRNTPHTTTGKSPAEMFLGRRLRTVLDTLKPNPRQYIEDQLWRQRYYHDRKAKFREFAVGQEVWVKNETTHGWKAGVIEERTGPLSYRVWVAGQVKRKHADHLRSRTGALDENPERHSGQSEQVTDENAASPEG